MTDGTYEVRLVMRDREGRAYRESKTFVIASQAPQLSVAAAKTAVRRGETLALRASASATARTIVARLYGAAPADLRWDARAKASVGSLEIPPDLPPGRYQIQVIAEDMAHNMAMREVPIDVLP
jgi:Ca-activated chloride channel family protein